MTNSVHTDTRTPSVPVRGGLAIVLAVLVNVVIVLGVDVINIASGFRALTIPPVAFLSAVGAEGAAVVYWLADRYVTDADRTYVRIAAVVLLLSFVPDMVLLATDPAATPIVAVVLMTTHVIVAAVSVGLLIYWRTEP